MSFINTSDPATSGHVVLNTTVGDIELGFWIKESPKAARNFIQLCLEGYYSDNIFHTITKNFIAITGDPTNTGDGGESAYGEPFRDEFHSRLKFYKRGLLATANSKKNDNRSQFFFTLGTTPELQNKHTIFGKVLGDSIYNLIKLNDCEVDCNDRPLAPPKIISATVVENPYPDIVPRTLPSASKDHLPHNVEEDDDEFDEDYIRRRKEQAKRKKLSFYCNDSDSSESESDSATARHPDSHAKNCALKRAPESDDTRVKKTRIEQRAPNHQEDTRPNKLTLDDEENNKLTKEQKLKKIRQELSVIRDQIECDANKHLLDIKSNRSSGKSDCRENQTLKKLNSFRAELKEATKITKENSNNGDLDDLGDLEDLEEELRTADSKEWLLHESSAEKEFDNEADLKTDHDLQKHTYHKHCRHDDRNRASSSKEHHKSSRRHEYDAPDSRRRHESDDYL